MTNEIAIQVDGVPKPQPRPRAFAIGGKARVYDPGTAEGWKGAIALAVGKHLPEKPIEGPVRVLIDFFMPRPKRLMRKRDSDEAIPHVSKPDVDNLAKAVLDCLTEIGMWGDDSQVWRLDVRKLYHAKNHRPGACIYIRYEEGGA